MIATWLASVVLDLVSSMDEDGNRRVEWWLVAWWLGIATGLVLWGLS